jgi:hypothetical protein
MKRLQLLSLLLLLNVSPTFADPWDSLTQEEADTLVHYIKNMPFIMDYCDCCDAAGEYASTVHLWKILHSEIVPSGWNQGFLNVNVMAQALAKVNYTDEGLRPDSLSPPEYTKEEMTLYMNYTWIYSPEKNAAVPLAKVIPYQQSSIPEESGDCRKYTQFPNPFESHIIQDSSYRSWYNHQFIP